MYIDQWIEFCSDGDRENEVSQVLQMSIHADSELDLTEDCMQ